MQQVLPIQSNRSWSPHNHISTNIQDIIAMCFLDTLITSAETGKKKCILKASLIFPANKKPNFFLQAFFLQAFLHFRQPQLQERYMYLIIRGTTQI